MDQACGAAVIGSSGLRSFLSGFIGVKRIQKIKEPLNNQ
jgi:hypothetical protein